MLSLVDVHTFYGNIQALKGVSLEVKEGEIITLIGANGAGKTTTLMSISGIVPPRTGDVHFMGTPLPA
jgi:branched-chain amino acid transport system ATP-binding protein